ncbi:MAG: hypothetical protein ACOY0T_25670 [Myxococcota bacterium]
MPPAEESPKTDPNPGSTVQSTGSAARASVDETRPRADETPSVIRQMEIKPSAPSSDTLLSAPTLTREDLALEERLSTAERNLNELMLRVEQLERRPLSREGDAPRLRWIWLLFLAGLALAWQILSRI